MLSDKVIKTLEDYIDGYISKYKTDSRTVIEILNDNFSNKEVAETEKNCRQAF